MQYIDLILNLMPNTVILLIVINSLDVIYRLDPKSNVSYCNIINCNQLVRCNI